MLAKKIEPENSRFLLRLFIVSYRKGGQIVLHKSALSPIF